MKIIAVGNSLYGDDGIGSAVLDTIRDGGLFPVAELLDMKTDALAMIDHFDPDSLHIVIDAVKMGKTPGTVVKFAPDDVEMVMQWDQLSLHGFGLAETFAMAKQIGKLPQQTVIIGVEPQQIDINNGLSPSVQKGIAKVISIIAEVAKNDRANHPGH